MKQADVTPTEFERKKRKTSYCLLAKNNSSIRLSFPTNKGNWLPSMKVES